MSTARLLVGFVLIGTLVLTATQCSSPGSVEAIRVVNPTDYTLAVEVGGTSSGWTAVGYVRKHSTTTLHAVADQGDTWRFQFRAQGEDAGQTTLRRHDLKNVDWTVRVPDAVQTRLRARGAPPSV